MKREFFFESDGIGSDWKVLASVFDGQPQEMQIDWFVFDKMIDNHPAFPENDNDEMSAYRAKSTTSHRKLIIYLNVQ